MSYEPTHGFVHRGEAGVQALPLDETSWTFLRTGDWPVSDRAALLQLHKVIEALVHHTIDQPLRSERVLRSVIRLELPGRGRTE